MYGLDVSDISPNSLKCLENTHSEMAKVLAIGWDSIEGLVGKARIDFLLLLEFTNTCISIQIKVWDQCKEQCNMLLSMIYQYL